MKYLIVALVVLVGLWSWRRSREDQQRESAARRPASPPAAPPPTDMVACAHCGVHLPATDALPGRHGVYCCESHRQAAS